MSSELDEETVKKSQNDSKKARHSNALLNGMARDNQNQQLLADSFKSCRFPSQCRPAQTNFY